MKEELKGKKFLITGGTGSFGHAVTDRLLKEGAGKIVIFSRDEKKQFDMAKEYGEDSRIRFVIGDVREYRSIRKAMTGMDYVFHAAALKQVPTCEFYPEEAVKTNILGGTNVIDAAIEAGVKKVIVLSTDKAAYPINAMGITKAMIERISVAKAKEQNGTVICRTRYPEQQIEIIGERPGEKMNEVLITKEEMANAEEYEHFYRILPDKHTLHYHESPQSHIKNITESYSSDNTERLDVDGMKRLLKKLPMFQ